MGERTEEFACTALDNGLLVVVSDHRSLGMVKFETRRDDIILTLEEAKRLAWAATVGRSTGGQRLTAALAIIVATLTALIETME